MTALKKDIELRRLECFKRLISNFPRGRIEPTEAPDFLVHDESRVVGIELTDLYRQASPPQAQQASEAMRRRVVARAQEIYASRQYPAVIATLFFNDRVPIKKAEVEPFSAEIADLVSKNILDANSSVEIRANRPDARRLPKVLYEFTVHRFDTVTKTFFSAPGATWAAPLGRADINRALASKAPRQLVYKTRCDEAWLVINADIAESMGTWFDFDSPPFMAPFETNFDRVFLVEHIAGKVHELRVIATGLYPQAPAQVKRSPA